MGKSRQLAAIMFADIVGYTAMMQEDEELAFELRSKLKDKLEDEVRNHGGRILEFKGDGALCSFNSAIEGVRAALGLQLAMQTAPFVPLRVGMHTVSYTHLRAHETGRNLVCRLLLEKK